MMNHVSPGALCCSDVNFYALSSRHGYHVLFLKKNVMFLLGMRGKWAVFLVNGDIASINTSDTANYATLKNLRCLTYV